MAVKIVFNPRLTAERISKTGIKSAQLWLDNEILKDSNYYAPFLTGESVLKSQITSKIGQGELIWGQPYDRRNYYGDNFNFTKDFNPNARSRWFEHAKAVNLNKWVDGASEIARDKRFNV